jgi:serine protease
MSFSRRLRQAFRARIGLKRGAVSVLAAVAMTAAVIGTEMVAAGPAQAVDNNVSYSDQGGDPGGVGVMTAPKVYLIFWGSQWGTQGTNADGDMTLSGDPSGAAPLLQDFFKGLGTDNEQWSGVMSQYCQGVPARIEFCSDANTQHVGYPTGGVLAGVWEDVGNPVAAGDRKFDYAEEAVAAAGHFGNSSFHYNKNDVYMVIPPPGADPALGSNVCATHSWNGGGDLLTQLGGHLVDSPYGPVTFAELAYYTDGSPLWANCGQNAGINGAVDAFTAMASHEYAETITDPFVPFALPIQGGWWGTGTLQEGR